MHNNAMRLLFQEIVLKAALDLERIPILGLEHERFPPLLLITQIANNNRSNILNICHLIDPFCLNYWKD